MLNIENNWQQNCVIQTVPYILKLFLPAIESAPT